MKPRRRNGATLGLVAVSVLVIIVIGVACYFLIKLFGGGREAANSIDSGCLNVAKQALRPKSTGPTAQLYNALPNATAEFEFYGDPDLDSNNPPSKISLFTYNRCVGQTVLMALNAKNEGTNQATQNLAQEFIALKKVSQALHNALVTTAGQANLGPSFSNVANSNNLRMYNDNTITQTDYKTAWMKGADGTGAGSTNVYFDVNTLPDSAAAAGILGAMLPSQTLNYTPVGNQYRSSAYYDPTNTTQYQVLGNAANPTGAYMSGYTPITIDGETFQGVPVFPQQKPHLVSLKTFNASTADDGVTPPNSFYVAAQTLDSKSQHFGGAVACAIVGAAFNGTGAYSTYQGNEKVLPDFPADFPNGYIAITNAAPAGGYNWGGPLDGQYNIFNWENDPTAGTPPLDLTTNGAGNTIFFVDGGTTSQAMSEWVDYNNAADPTNWYNSVTGSYQNGMPTISLSGIYVTTDHTNASPAQATDMIGVTVRSQINCVDDLITNNWHYPPGTGDRCYDNWMALNSAYTRSMNGPMGSDFNSAQPYWSNVDNIKEQICQDFNTPAITITAPSGPSGLGEYKIPLANLDAGPHDLPWNGQSVTNTPPLEQPSHVMDLLNQVGGCALGTVMTEVTQRCNELCPGIRQSDVQTLLSTGPILYMGGTLYIERVNPADGRSGLQISATPPAGVSSPSLNADGDPGESGAMCAGTPYSLYDKGLIDSINNTGQAHTGGDDNLHQQPYTQDNNPEGIDATDHATFTKSSGYQGLLGNLHFYQTTTGSATFSRPN